MVDVVIMCFKIPQRNENIQCATLDVFHLLDTETCSLMCSLKRSRSISMYIFFHGCVFMWYVKEFSFDFDVHLFCHVCLYIAIEALQHPYLAKLHDESDEPICPTPFVVEVDELSLSEKDMKDIIYEESMRFNPQLRT